tara:strand:- start:961 stop:1182 length:222 start_codon:yes stop_codon:yes gene_type:complete
MTTKKKETKKTEKKVDDKDARIAELEQLLLQNNANIQTLVNTANNYIALCQHYEQTINILTGRIQEITRKKNE